MINIKSFGVKRKDGGSSSSSGSGGGYANTTVNTTVNSVKIWGQPHDHTSDVDGDITTSGSITAQGTLEANSIHSNTTIEAGGAISGDDGIFGGDVSCVDVHCSNINCAGDIEANTVDTNELTATDGTITNLVTDFLTVTKQAHFFELIIDKLKSNSGQVILSAANAKIDKVVKNEEDYYCYWRKKDETTNKAIDNEFVLNDQVRCQTFNAQEGTNYNGSNKYYWRLVTEVGTDTTTIDGEEVVCNYVALSDTDKDGTSVPEVGDEIVQLGNRTDTTRQSAIILSSIASIDSNVQAPSIVQYTGINGYTLDGHILNQMAANGNTFTGDFKVITGNTTTDVKDLVSGTLPTIVTNSDAAFIMANSRSQITSISECQNLPTNIQLYEGTTQIPYSSWTSRSYIKNGTQRQVSLKASTIRQETGLCVTAVADDRNGGCNVTWAVKSKQSIDGTVTPVTVTNHNCTIYIEYTDGTDTKTITKNVPLNVITNGATITGADAEFDKMKVNDCDLTVQVSNVLNITADVQVQHVKGSTVTTLSDVTDFTCSLRLNNAGAYYTLTRGTDKFTLSRTVGGFMDLTTPPTSAILTLTDDTTRTIVDKFVVPIKFNAGAMLQVKNDAITAAVQQSNTYTDNEITTVNADIAQLQVTADNISTRVTNIEGDYVTGSELTQTANNIQLNVYNELNQKTGIDVSNGKITLNAATTEVSDDLVVKRLSTKPTNGKAQVKIEGSTMDVYGLLGNVNIQFGVDANGYAVLKYLDNDGTLLYDLGPEGIRYVDVVEERFEVFANTYYKLSNAANVTAHTITPPSTFTTIYKYYAKQIGNVITSDTFTTASAKAMNRLYFTQQLTTQTQADTYESYLVTGTFLDKDSELHTIGDTTKEGVMEWQQEVVALGYSGDVVNDFDWTTQETLSGDYVLATPIKYREYVSINEGVYSSYLEFWQ